MVFGNIPRQLVLEKVPGQPMLESSMIINQSEQVLVFNPEFLLALCKVSFFFLIKDNAHLSCTDLQSSWQE